MAVIEQTHELDVLNAMSPEELLRWSVETHGERAAIITSFQNTGCVMIDMAARMGLPIRIATIDTLRLHDETYALMAAIQERYGYEIEHFTPDPDKLREMIEENGEYLFFDSREGQVLCCDVRKVEPNQRALASVDAWITGLRRDHSDGRKGTPRAAYIRQDGRPLYKLSPLADWTEEQIWEYIHQRNVPYNALYDKGFTSIGCVICTTPTRQGEDKRAGRWRWFNSHPDSHQKECGIHIGGSGI